MWGLGFMRAVVPALWNLLMPCSCSQAAWQTLSCPVSEFGVAGPPEVVVASPIPFCSSVWVLILGAMVGFRGFELLRFFSVCYFKKMLGRKKKKSSLQNHN